MFVAGVGGNGRLVLLLVVVLVVVVVGGVAGNRRSTEDGLLMDRGGEMREDEGRGSVDADDELCCLLALCALFTLISSILALALVYRYPYHAVDELPAFLMYW